MNSLNGLTEYLQHIERRLRVLVVSRGVAMAGLAALAFTVAGALAANYFAFSSGSVFGARLVLFLALAGALGAGLILPLLRLNRRNAAQQARGTEQERKPLDFWWYVMIVVLALAVAESLVGNQHLAVDKEAA